VAPTGDDTHEGLSWSNGSGGRTAFDGERAHTDENGDERGFDAYPFVLGGNVPVGAVTTGFEIRIRGYDGTVSAWLSPDGMAFTPEFGLTCSRKLVRGLGESSPWLTHRRRRSDAAVEVHRNGDRVRGEAA
jgi:hypothetical protein